MVEVETKVCGTCEEQIPIQKHKMHELGCARMNYKCTVCGEVVAKEDKEEHEEEADAHPHVSGLVVAHLDTVQVERAHCVGRYKTV